jgi:hypothetical protein
MLSKRSASNKRLMRKRLAEARARAFDAFGADGSLGLAMMRTLVKNPSSRLAKAVGEALWALGKR